jgi:hypothetical protein
MSKKRKKTQPTAPGIPPGDQQILDEICDAIAGQGGYGMTGWTIGKTDDVVEYVATRLGRRTPSVSRGLARLIGWGLLAADCHEPWDPDEDAPLLGWTSVEEPGWRQWSLWDPSDERMIEFGRDQFQADPIWEVTDLAELAAAADRFRRGYRGRGTPPADCFGEDLAEHFRTFFGGTEGRDAGKKGERLKPVTLNERHFPAASVKQIGHGRWHLDRDTVVMFWTGDEARLGIADSPIRDELIVETRTFAEFLEFCRETVDHEISRIGIIRPGPQGNVLEGYLPLDLLRTDPRVEERIGRLGQSLGATEVCLEHGLTAGEVASLIRALDQVLGQPELLAHLRADIGAYCRMPAAGGGAIVLWDLERLDQDSIRIQIVNRTVTDA